MVQADQQQNGRSVRLRPGQLLTLTLGENPTTGYHWRVASGAEPICTLEGEQYEAPAGPPGRGGVHHWRFRAVSAGHATIRLLSERRWSSDEAPAREFVLHVQVSG